MFLYCSIAEKITQALLRVFKSKELVTMLVSILPVVEARGAVPIGFSYGLHPLLVLLYAFLGSSLMAPILIAVLLPFVRWLSKTRLFRRIGQTLYDKFESKSKTLESKTEAADETAANDGKKRRISPDFKKMLGIFAFVAIPLPMTGVWTGSAVAALSKLSYPKAVVSVVCGNLVATSILTLLCYLLPQQAIDWIILAIGIIAIAAVVVFIFKIIFHKSAPQEAMPQESVPETENKEQ